MNILCIVIWINILNPITVSGLIEIKKIDTNLKALAIRKLRK
jgi:hypothetical protein